MGIEMQGNEMLDWEWEQEWGQRCGENESGNEMLDWEWVRMEMISQEWEQ